MRVFTVCLPLPPLLELEIAKRDLFNTPEVCAKAAI